MGDLFRVLIFVIWTQTSATGAGISVIQVAPSLSSPCRYSGRFRAFMNGPSFADRTVGHLPSRVGSNHRGRGALGTQVTVRRGLGLDHLTAWLRIAATHPAWLA